MVTILRRNVPVVCGASYHLLGYRISQDSKIRFRLQVESYISDWLFSESRLLASYVSRHKAMAYDSVAASSVRWWSCRRWRMGAQLQWMAGSQRACGSRQQMWHACNSMQQSGVYATACSGSKWVGSASSTIAMEDSDGSRWRWRRKEQRLTATSC